MKKALLSMAMILVSSSAFAGMQRVDLMSGSSVRLNVNETTIVTCDGSSSSESSALKPCEVKRTPYNTAYFDVSVGDTTMQGLLSFEGALLAVKKLRDAGLCK